MIGCIIKNHQAFPIPGGWGVEYEQGGQLWQVNGRTPERVVQDIIAIQKVNGAFNGEQAVWDYCNAIWAARAPSRVMVAGSPARSISPVKKRRDHWDHGPEKYGPILWFWLHSFGMKFDQDGWNSAIRRITAILDPRQSPGNGCDKCFAEWSQILATEKPFEVSNEEQAARWSFNVHNRVNKKLGYRQFQFGVAARMYGWKVEI